MPIPLGISAGQFKAFVKSTLGYNYSQGNIIVPDGITQARIMCCGRGGPGGSVNYYGDNNYWTCAGGGGGGQIIAMVTGLTGGETLTVNGAGVYRGSTQLIAGYDGSGGSADPGGSAYGGNGGSYYVVGGTAIAAGGGSNGQARPGPTQGSVSAPGGSAGYIGFTIATTNMGNVGSTNYGYGGGASNGGSASSGGPGIVTIEWGFDQ